MEIRNTEDARRNLARVIADILAGKEHDEELLEAARKALQRHRQGGER